MDDLPYIAGFFDGEGCVHTRFDRGNTSLSVSITQMNVMPLRLVMEHFGGVIARASGQRSGRPLWQWRLNGGRKSANFLAALLPWLLVKRGEAQMAIAMQAITPSSSQRVNVGRKADLWVRAERQAYALAIREAKRFTYNAEGGIQS